VKNLIRFLNTPADSILFEKKWGNIQPTEADIFLKKFSLEEKLLKFQSHKGDSLSLEDALRGIVIFGATGSGKTSDSGEMIANSFLRKKMGGLILCVKQEEAQEWTKRALKCGRKKDLVLIETGSPYFFNFLDWQQKNNTNLVDLVTNVTDFFLEVMAIIDRGVSTKSVVQKGFLYIPISWFIP
jgi:hypothetical protein